MQFSTTFFYFAKWIYIGFLSSQLLNHIIRNFEFENFNNMLENLAIDILKCFVKTKYCIIKKSEQAYNNYWIVKFIYNLSNNTYSYAVFIIRKFVYNIPTEPNYEEWISICRLVKDDVLNGEPIYKYLETYYNISDCSHLMIDKILDILIHEVNDSTQKNNSSNKEKMLVMKNLEGKYVYFIIKGEQPIKHIKNNDYKQLRSPFLSIEYSHPKMKHRLYIDIDNNIFLQNNQILSPLFIKRYLQYQGKPHYFDLDYKLHLIDKNIKFIELTSKEYIELTDRDYIVKTI